MPKNNLLAIPLSLLLLITACSGGSGGDKDVINPPPADPIPDTVAVSAVIPEFISQQADIAQVESAVLRHVHRNTVFGNIHPKGDYIDSNNAKVEQLNLLGFYSEIEKNTDNSYQIPPQDNGLAYFRVTNTKANGKVRVHNFYGVPPGHYMTFDSTNADNEAKDNYQTFCRNVSVRITDLVKSASEQARLLINGRIISDAVFSGNKAYTETLSLCPVDDGGHYLALVVYENAQNDISYGFNYYRQLQDNDLLEITLEHQAEMIPWSADLPIDNEYRLGGMNNKWRVQVPLYISPEGGNSHQSGTSPKFSELGLDSYHFTSDVTDSSVGMAKYQREFAGDTLQNEFIINQLVFDDINLNSLDLTWNNSGTHQPDIISGTIFDQGLTQTYAFMSMDPDLLAQGRLTFPLDDVPHLITSSLVGLVGASAAQEANFNFVGDAAFHAGHLYWPQTHASDLNGTDLIITANGSEFIQLLLGQLTTP
ncbi:hypothetical protein [Thalassomonas sp. RHCl1]|uniref:hypothetical protein n=1 Tax=Thalassomonas sp. RHCl1 TaxID=2995320 RepID=UPI00248B18E7|nr:hypothetical protein [Thalassomonas sp. RHCl1]